MRAFLRAVLIATSSVTIAGASLAQSSSNPFAGLFGGGDDLESPVDLQIRVAGDNDGLENTIRNSSLIQGSLREQRDTGQDVLAAARGDYARILGALYDEGYYSAIIYITLDGVEAAEIAPLDAPEEVRQVIVSVDPGPQFTFSRAAIAPVAPNTDLPSEYARGEIAGTGTIRSAATAAVDGWRAASYAKADVAGQEITADHTASTVDSQIALDPGPPVTFGRLISKGNERLSTRRLHKIAGLPEGERFDPEALETVRERLRRSGVFSAITLEEAETVGPGSAMDIYLTVVEQKTRRVGAGFEISNTDGAMVSAYWMHRNLLGGGERLRVEADINDMGSKTTGRDDTFSIRLDRPATIHPDITAYIETEITREREEDYDSDAASIALGFNYIRSERLTADLALEYFVSRVTDATGETDFKVVAVPMNVMWDRRDVINDPKRGYYLSGDLVPFIGFGDTDSGLVTKAEARGFYSLGQDDRFTLAGRTIVGSILGSEIQNTPREYLFFSGGGGTVRGQPYQSLGSRAIAGPDSTVKTGGMSIATASAELRFQVRERIGLVAFADYGQVWDESAFGGENASHAGAGIGVRYSTPIGPLRFDVAAPVGGDTGDGVQLYLGLGQAF